MTVQEQVKAKKKKKKTCKSIGGKASSINICLFWSPLRDCCLTFSMNLVISPGGWRVSISRTPPGWAHSQKSTLRFVLLHLFLDAEEEDEVHWSLSVLKQEDRPRPARQQHTAAARRPKGVRLSLSLNFFLKLNWIFKYCVRFWKVISP